MERSKLTCPAAEQPWRSGIRCLLLLRAAGHQAYLVGGCVRDLILARPVKDADVATSARPEEVERVCTAAGLALRAGRPQLRRGGGGVRGHRGRDRDLPPRRRLPRWPPSRARGLHALGRGGCGAPRFHHQRPALRSRRGADWIDHVGGRRDLAERRLRTVGVAAERLAEDRLRVLRGLRFAAQLGLTSRRPPGRPCARPPSTGLSAERLMQEWFKGLAGEHRGSWLGPPGASGQLARLCPPLGALAAGDRARLGAHLDALGAAGPALAAAAWLLPCGQPGLDWLARQPLAAERVARIRWLVEHALLAEALAGGARAARRRVLQHPGAGELVQLLRSDPQAGSAAAQRLHRRARAGARPGPLPAPAARRRPARPRRQPRPGPGRAAAPARGRPAGGRAYDPGPGPRPWRRAWLEPQAAGRRARVDRSRKRRTVSSPPRPGGAPAARGTVACASHSAKDPPWPRPPPPPPSPPSTSTTSAAASPMATPRSRPLLGGKGANLAEMSRRGFAVPDGFTITTEVCTHYYANRRTYPAGLFEKGVPAAVASSRRPRGKKFGDAAESPAGLGALRRARLHARHDGHRPQPGPQRPDRRRPRPRPATTPASPTTPTAASS